MRARPRRVARALVALWALGAAVPALTAQRAWAAGLAGPQADVDAGRYQQAYAAASAVDEAGSQVLAAEAASDYAVYVLTDAAKQKAWLQRASQAAERAIALDPSSAAAYVQLARAKGEIARRAGVFASMGVVGQLKDLFDKALKLDPNEPDALVGLALWNLELTQRGVGWLFGARRDVVLPLLRRGVSQAPDQINLHVEYATALRALGHAAQADAQLRLALSLPARTAEDRYEQQRARQLLGD